MALSASCALLGLLFLTVFDSAGGDIYFFFDAKWALWCLVKLCSCFGGGGWLNSIHVGVRARKATKLSRHLPGETSWNNQIINLTDSFG